MPFPDEPSEAWQRDPKSWLKRGLAVAEGSRNGSIPSLPQGTRFGEYELIRELGQGGMGVVYEARAHSIEQRVALKRLRAGSCATASEVRRFLREAEAAANLDHPNAVKALHVGEHDGQPFFTMRLVEGQSLAQELKRRASHAESTSDGRASPRTPASLRADVELMVIVADAVHHAHTRGLLHRDIKPGNILLDDDGKPHVADFGLAIHLDRQAGTTQSDGGIAGTPAYMPPEQILQGSGKLDFTADVYSLGAVLYEMLTGRAPFEGESLQELSAKICAPDPVTPPRILEPNISRDLEAVCLKCLEKKPERRYASAALLAADLDCVARGLPPSIPPLSARGRAWHWVRRHPRQSAAAAKVGVLTVAVVSALVVAWGSAVRAERASLGTNAFLASAQAGAALFQLREYADRVERAASDPDVVSLAHSETLESPLVLQRLLEGLDNAFVVSSTGTVRAQAPDPPYDIKDRDYSFRDYFKCSQSLAERGRRGACVARAFRSERDEQLKFGVSAPLYDQGKWVGVLVAVAAADSVFGKVRMTSPEDGRVTALFGPRDVDRDGKLAAPFVHLVHDGLPRGAELRAPANRSLVAAFREASPPGEQFSLRYAPPRFDENYEDAMPGFGGRWLAAFAPVGGTGYVMVVQSKRASVGQMLRDLRRGAAAW